MGHTDARSKLFCVLDVERLDDLALLALGVAMRVLRFATVKALSGRSDAGTTAKGWEKLREPRFEGTLQHEPEALPEATGLNPQLHS